MFVYGFYLVIVRSLNIIAVFGKFYFANVFLCIYYKQLIVISFKCKKVAIIIT